MREDCWYKDVCTRETCDACIRFMEMSYLMDNSGIPKKKQMPSSLTAGIDINEFEYLANIKNDIVNWVNEGNNLYICSEFTGNGKTSWAIKLLLKYFDSVWAGNGFRARGYFVHTPTFLTMLKDFDNEDIKKLKLMLTTVDVVVWDDIAGSKLSDYDISQLLIYVDQRNLQELANIYTGNIVTMDNLIECVGNRLASRIWQYSDIVQFKAKDKR